MKFLFLFISICTIIQAQSTLTQNIISLNRITGTVATISLLGTSLVSTGDAVPVSTSILSQIMSYIRYVDLPYSEDLVEIFENDKKTDNLLIIDMNIKVPNWLEDEFAEDGIDEVFIRNGFSGSFLKDFWRDLMFILLIGAILIIISLILIALEKLEGSTKFPRGFQIFEKIQVGFKNLLVSQIYNNFGQVLLLFVFQLMVVFNKSSSFKTIFNLCLASLFLLIGFITLGIHGWLARRKQKTQKILLAENDDEKKCWQVLFVSYNEQSIFNQLCLAFLVVRALLSSLIISLGYKHQVLQASLLLTTNVIMLLYIFFKMPFKRKFDLAQQICCEAVIMVANICVLMLAMSQYKTPNDSLNSVTITLRVAFYFIPIVFLGIKVVVSYLVPFCPSLKKQGQIKKQKGNNVKKNSNGKKIFPMTPGDLLSPSNLMIKDSKRIMMDETTSSSFNFMKFPSSPSKFMNKHREEMEHFGTPRRPTPRLLMLNRQINKSIQMPAVGLDLGSRSPDASMNGSVAINSLAFDGSLSPIKFKK